MTKSETRKVNLRELVKTLSKDNGVALKEVAKEIGVKPPNVSYWFEKNNCSLNRFRQMMNALGEEVIVKTKNGKEYKLD